MWSTSPSYQKMLVGLGCSHPLAASFWSERSCSILTSPASQTSWRTLLEVRSSSKESLCSFGLGACCFCTIALVGLAPPPFPPLIFHSYGSWGFERFLQLRRMDGISSAKFYVRLARMNEPQRPDVWLSVSLSMGHGLNVFFMGVLLG